MSATDLLTERPKDNPPLLSISLLSASALAYEVLLVRLFSIIHWHHFTFMIISLALLGYGISGSFIALFRNWLLQRYEAVFIANTLLFALSTIGCFSIVQHFPFNSLEILWDHSQWSRLLFSFVLLSLPFFFVANAIALSLMHFHRQMARVYGFDLLAAGLGALAIMIMLLQVTPETALRLLAATGVLATAVFKGHVVAMKPIWLLSIVFMALLFMLPPSWIHLEISPYKGLPQTLQMKGATTLVTEYSPIARTDIVENTEIPFRYAPGLSMHSPAKLPHQLAVFRDGDAMQVIDRVISRDDQEYHRFLDTALPYHMHDSPRDALILNAATGSQLLQAHSFGTQNIDAVEADAFYSTLVQHRYRDFINWPLVGKQVKWHNMSARAFTARDHQYDLVILGPPAGSSGGAAGVHALASSFDMTVEALESYLRQLKPDGLLSITQWTSTPARHNLKLFATAVQAIRQSGVQQPRDHVAWIRSWNTATLVMKPTPLTERELDGAREFSRIRGFDVNWLPDISTNETNRFQVLPQPLYYQFALATFDKTDTEFMQAYQYHIKPATDDRPYLDHFFKWSSLERMLDLPAVSGVALLGVGYPTLLITLLQALVAALVLILLPLLLLRKKASQHERGKIQVVVYFLSIGLSFLFIEMAFIQKFTLILSQPLYAVALTLCAFLIFSGLGSLYVQSRLQHDEQSTGRLLSISVMMIGLITFLFYLLLPVLTPAVMALPEIWRIIVTFLMAAPLAFFMGMPFPLGLSRLQLINTDFIPWAWGINGCASVLSAILAVLLAIHIGFSGVMISAILLYAIAWLFQIKPSIVNHT